MFFSVTVLLHSVMFKNMNTITSKGKVKWENDLCDDQYFDPASPTISTQRGDEQHIDYTASTQSNYYNDFDSSSCDSECDCQADYVFRGHNGQVLSGVAGPQGRHIHTENGEQHCLQLEPCSNIHFPTPKPQIIGAGINHPTLTRGNLATGGPKHARHYLRPQQVLNDGIPFKQPSTAAAGHTTAPSVGNIYAGPTMPFQQNTINTNQGANKEANPRGWLLRPRNTLNHSNSKKHNLEQEFNSRMQMKTRMHLESNSNCTMLTRNQRFPRNVRTPQPPTQIIQTEQPVNYTNGLLINSQYAQRIPNGIRQFRTPPERVMLQNQTTDKQTDITELGVHENFSYVPPAVPNYKYVEEQGAWPRMPFKQTSYKKTEMPQTEKFPATLTQEAAIDEINPRIRLRSRQSKIDSTYEYISHVINDNPLTEQAMVHYQAIKDRSIMTATCEGKATVQDNDAQTCCSLGQQGCTANASNPNMFQFCTKHTALLINKQHLEMKNKNVRLAMLEYATNKTLSASNESTVQVKQNHTSDIGEISRMRKRNQTKHSIANHSNQDYGTSNHFNSSIPSLSTSYINYEVSQDETPEEADKITTEESKSEHTPASNSHPSRCEFTLTNMTMVNSPIKQMPPKNKEAQNKLNKCVTQLKNGIEGTAENIKQSNRESEIKNETKSKSHQITPEHIYEKLCQLVMENTKVHDEKMDHRSSLSHEFVFMRENTSNSNCSSTCETRLEDNEMNSNTDSDCSRAFNNVQSAINFEVNMENELWQQCVRWLISTGVLPRQHKTTQRGAQIFDLAQTLRDGVVLCNLLNVIKPGAVDLQDINIRPQMLQFLCLQNLRKVIHSLRNVFGIPPQELFQPADLYDMINVRQVLKVLSMLSQLQVSSMKFRPFPLDTGQLRNSMYRSEEDEEIYRNLPDMASERELVDEQDNLYDCVAEEEKEEGIYGSLIAVKPSTVVPKDQRSYCVTEIVETERNYVQHLDMMQRKFIEPLRRTLENKDMRIIFSNLDQMWPVHKEFLKNLESSKNDNMKKMSRPFITYKDRFLMYGQYCSNLQDALSYLGEIMKDERIRMAIEDCQNNASPSKFKLRELLCVSMQRILKYHLLVKELHKHTSDSHTDKSDLGKALESMQELSKYVNEVKRDSEMLTTINKVESCMIDYTMEMPLQAYGHILKDGELKIKSVNDKSSKTRFTYLFDQALFMTSQKNETYKLKDLVRLQDFRLDEMPQNKAAKWAWNWSLKDKHGFSCYTLYAKTSMDKMKWLESIKFAFDNINPIIMKGKQHYFKMTSFKEPTYCSYCKKLLLGSFFQGYMCERTNKTCHKLCLPNAWQLVENSLKETPPVPNRPSLHESPPSVPPGRHSSTVQHPTSSLSIGVTYKAHRDYNGIPSSPFAGTTYITFSQGELIEVDEQITPEWWVGHTMSQYDRKGYFPASYVSPMTTRPSGRPGRNSNYIQSQPGERMPGGACPVPTANTKMPTQLLPLDEYDWYAGQLDRTGAERLLRGKPTGTFLVRTRDGHMAISLMFKEELKHIKINQSPENMYYVAECKNFKSVQELIRFYQENPMNTSFMGLETTLKIPYRDPEFFPDVPGPNLRTNHRHSLPETVPIRPNPGLQKHSTFTYRESPTHRINGVRQISVSGRTFEVLGQARVRFDFDSRGPQELSLKANQIVNIISKAGDEHGWWKGEHEGRIGYFPSSFIDEISR